MRHFFIVALSLFSLSSTQAQTLLTLSQCESLFFKNNLQLLAGQLNIEKSKASIIQAKIWSLPQLSGEINLFNPGNNTFFDVGQQGEKIIAAEQLIYLGGKKRKEIDFAKANVSLAELQFEQLLRNLNFELRSTFYSLYYTQKEINGIKNQLDKIDTLISAYNKQVEKGNIALKEVVRLRSLALSFLSDVSEMQKSINGMQEKLKILTNTQDEIIAVVDDSLLNIKLNKPIELDLKDITSKALTKNPDYLSSIKIVESNELYLKFQKSLVIPDITIGASYDQNGGAFKRQSNVTFGIPLALWNSNKGNIKIAENEIKQSNYLKEQTAIELRSKIAETLKNFNFQQRQYVKNITTTDDFDTVYKGVLKNFLKGNLSMIEFTDFMESYNRSILFLNEIKLQTIISGEMINKLVNENIF